MFDWFQMDQSTGGHFEKLCEIVGRLRAPGGCPWDREQTHESLLPAIIEEAYEVVEAARTRDDAHFCEELGDLVLLVVMHAEIAHEAGRFNIDKILCEISDKLVRRHPHVFGNQRRARFRRRAEAMGSDQASREKSRLPLSGQFAQSAACAKACAEGAIQGGASAFRLG